MGLYGELALAVFLWQLFFKWQPFHGKLKWNILHSPNRYHADNQRQASNDAPLNVKLDLGRYDTLSGMEKMSCDYLDGDASVKSINMLLSTKAQQSDHPTNICDKNDAVNNQSYLRNTA